MELGSGVGLQLILMCSGHSLALKLFCSVATQRVLMVQLCSELMFEVLRERS